MIMNLIKYSLEDQIKLKMIFIYDVKWIEKLVFILFVKDLKFTPVAEKIQDKVWQEQLDVLRELSTPDYRL